MSKPSVSAVKSWEVVYRSDLVQLEVGSAVFDGDYWRLTNFKNGKKKYFYGESAWSNSKREASDLDFQALFA